MKAKYWLIGALMLLLVVLLAACSPAPAPATPCPDCPTCPEAPACPECPACPAPEEPVVAEVPYQDEWANSPHNDTEAEAFNHWNEEDPAEVPTNCANCHTSDGYQEYVATGQGEVSAPIPAPAGTIQCVACHNEATATMTSVKFPQTYVPEEGGDPVNVEVTGLGPEARCMVCHQGRASTSTVNASIARFGEDVDPDAVPAPVTNDAGDEVSLGFTNIHYYPAGATLYGTQVKGGYEYDGQSYDGKFRHVEGIDTCVGCHSSHTLEVKVETCAECHEGVASVEDLRNVRMAGSLADYDGDGDVEESIDSELKGLQEVLYPAIVEYAKNVAGAAIVYNPDAYPYFFADANENGAADEGEEGYANWTPRLLKAAYNYQMSVKDPGAFAHNAKYMIQLMYDSTADLNENLGNIDMAAMHRQDPGHFAGNTEAFRHWDEDGMVEGGCVKCHQAEGVPQFLENGANIAMEPSNGFMCTTCHNEEEWPARYVVESVTFPSGAEVSFGGVDADGNFVADESNLCILCHQGRSSTPSVNRALGDRDSETPDPSIRFTNIHYFAAGATLFGAMSKAPTSSRAKSMSGKMSRTQSTSAPTATMSTLWKSRWKPASPATAAPAIRMTRRPTAWTPPTTMAMAM
jgi:osmotically-inducible protein OsmY